jgi:NAD(P)-dependent dehydrogenase (short-subunit alcohol dehydrogenase family)
MAVSGRHALVTGGGSGVGRAIALALAGEGVAVTICGRRIEPLEETAAQSPHVHALAADVTDEASVAALYEKAQAARGPFDIVVANAGMAASAPAARTPLALWHQTISVNLTGAFLSARPAMDTMRKARGGRIVFIASTAGLKGYPYVAPYVAAKHGVVGLMRALAVEFAESGVTVNAVCPGFVETDMLDESVARIVATTGRSEAQARDALAATNPQGRFIQPEEVAAAVLYLCSAGAGSITGQAISVSGGETW